MLGHARKERQGGLWQEAPRIRLGTGRPAGHQLPWFSNTLARAKCLKQSSQIKWWASRVVSSAPCSSYQRCRGDTRQNSAVRGAEHRQQVRLCQPGTVWFSQFLQLWPCSSRTTFAALPLLPSSLLFIWPPHRFSPATRSHVLGCSARHNFLSCLKGKHIPGRCFQLNPTAFDQC